METETSPTNRSHRLTLKSADSRAGGEEWKKGHFHLMTVSCQPQPPRLPLAPSSRPLAFLGILLKRVTARIRVPPTAPAKGKHPPVPVTPTSPDLRLHHCFLPSRSTISIPPSKFHSETSRQRAPRRGKVSPPISFSLTLIISFS